MAETTKLAGILSVISYVAFGLAVLFLILAVYFWFRYNIPAVVGDLTGRTARKSIARIRESNEKKASKPKNGTAGIKNSRKAETARIPSLAKGNTTAKLEDNERPETGLLEENRITGVVTEETALLDQGTVPLEAEGTMPLYDGTVPLAEDTAGAEEASLLYSDGTTPLDTGAAREAAINAMLYDGTEELDDKPSELVIIDDIMLTDTDEKI